MSEVPSWRHILAATWLLLGEEFQVLLAQVLQLVRLTQVLQLMLAQVLQLVLKHSSVSQGELPQPTL